MSKLLTPTHYTRTEGGNWLVYEGLPVTKKFLKESRKLVAEIHSSDHINRRVDTINFFGKPVHSLAFNYPPCGRVDDYARWDILNGWTVKMSKTPPMSEQEATEVVNEVLLELLNTVVECSHLDNPRDTKIAVHLGKKEMAAIYKVRLKLLSKSSGVELVLGYRLVRSSMASFIGFDLSE